MSEDPFPDSSVDFYERIQVLKVEIERWKAENNSLRLDAVEYRRLITELADALYDHMGFNTKRTFTQDEKLVQRAREATK